MRPGLVREGRIGDDVVVGAELLAVVELGLDQRVLAAETILAVGKSCRIMFMRARPAVVAVLLLPLQRDVLAGLGGHLQQQRARAAGRVVGGGGGYWCSAGEMPITLAMMRLTSDGV